MKIEKIELSGFKSFAEKTTIYFHPGVTGIVGPNGCGKSNIVDAIKWLLGEQSAKALRGDRMDEVIFNGSETRKPRGMAEVSLYISGLPASSDENGSSDNQTVISRRLYRSGESEYSINNNPCRLKDIKDLLLDTGLDIKNYFIFEQERITQLINAKPQDRRFLIEEIAGVVKYKVKKTEALQKLEQSKLNLQRIDDIIGEVKRQLNSLDRQVKKAERYKRLSEERKNIELYLSKIQFNELNSQISQLLDEINKLKTEEASLRSHISKKDNLLQERRFLLIEREKNLSDLYLSVEEKEKLIAENEKALIQATSKIEAFERDRERLEQERQERLQKIEELGLQIKSLNAERDFLEREVGEIKQKMEELMNGLKIDEADISDIELMLEEKRKALFKLSDELSIKMNEKTRIQTTLDSIHRRDSAIQKEIGDILLRIEQIEEEIGKIEEDIKSSSEEVISLKDRKEELLRMKEKTKQEMEILSSELLIEKERLASNLSRLNSLKELVLNETTLSVFKETEDLHIEGLLSEFLEVPEIYERAIEGLLSQRIDAFILSDLESLKRAIALIKEKGTARTPLINKADTGKPFESVEESRFNKAIDVVTVSDHSLRDLIRSILGNAIIVQDIDEAFRLRKEGFNQDIATIDGDIIDKDGIVWSGKGREVLKRRREIKELESTVEVLRDRLNKKTEELQKKKSNLLYCEQELHKVESLINVEETHLTGLRHNFESLLEEKERLNKRVSYASIEREELVRERDSLMGELKDVERIIAEIEEKRKFMETEIENIRDGLLKRRQEVERKRQDYSDLRMAYTKVSERYGSTFKEIETRQKEIEAIERKTREIIETINSFHKEREMLLQDINNLKLTISEQAKEVNELKEKIGAERQIIQEENKVLMEIEEGIKKLRGSLEVVIERLNELNLKNTEASVRLESIKEAIRINYGINIEELNESDILFSWRGNNEDSVVGEVTVHGGEVTVEELSERLESIRKKIEALGPVSLGTIEEYEELKERYNFLTSQREDLTKSIAELEEAIQKINTTTRRKLREAFDALNEKFGEVFQTLFGGGKASLILTDENNILESGIEIIAQPPGKRLQNINLLSGGEKALTVLSLLIASFLIKPAPLCVLDEVDAPLDESNVERFAKMIKELSNLIQFIVITHNKTTMSYCDYLYGITMEEKGVSKVISLQLTQV